MKVFLNGKETMSQEEAGLEDVIRALGFNPERVVVQHNGRILTREEWKDVFVRENDRIDVLQFVGGG